jgi:predicted metal-dependent HD superfamily phosphohydrolase
MQFKKAKSYISKRMRKELPGHLSYHSLAHIKDVYEAAIRIAKGEGLKKEELTLLLTAVLYHDCGFIIQSKDHEKISCDIVRASLPQFAYNNEQIEKICGMIMATIIPQTTHNLLEQIICDADLDYLGRDDFFVIGNKLFHEMQMYGIIKNENEWNKLQINFLKQHHFFTQTAINTREQKKQEHLKLLKSTLK